MKRYIIHRLLILFPLLLAISFLTFIMIYLAPGDPISTQFGLQLRGMDPERINEIREQLGLNDPILIQYLRYLANLLRGDMGRSLTTHQPVSREILTRLPATLQLTFASMLFVLVIAIPLGIVSAVKRGSLLDNVCMGGALVGVSMPSF
ncbi:MAG TPA: ABC transporter permease, partial [Chloroflexi bacterium]|nr:ABC transporter permease [Chloroflexota bacterium]